MNMCGLLGKFASPHHHNLCYGNVNYDKSVYDIFDRKTEFEK